MPAVDVTSLRNCLGKWGESGVVIVVSLSIVIIVMVVMVVG